MAILQMLQSEVQLMRVETTRIKDLNLIYKNKLHNYMYNVFAHKYILYIVGSICIPLCCAAERLNKVKKCHQTDRFSIFSAKGWCIPWAEIIESDIFTCNSHCRWEKLTQYKIYIKFCIFKYMRHFKIKFMTFSS